MYYQFFGVIEDPFAMTPDPTFLFLTGPHREALAGAQYSIFQRKGFVLLTGDAGTGKTTLLTQILRSMPELRVRFSLVRTPTVTPAEFLELTLLGFGIRDVPASKPQRITLLQAFLIETNANGKLAVLLVDEAHKLSTDVLEEIRLLGNIEVAERKVLQIVLAGQTELSAVLNREDMRQLKQRIAVRLAIQPLSRQGVQHYIKHRWERAGGNHPPFDADALARIAEWSRGIPRLVNTICDNALAVACAEESKIVGARHIQEAAEDLDIISSGSRSIRFVAENGPPLRQMPELAKPVVSGVRDPVVAIREGTNGTTDGIRPLRDASIPTLDRYRTDFPKSSKMMELMGKLGFSDRTSKPTKRTER